MPNPPIYEVVEDVADWGDLPPAKYSTDVADAMKREAKLREQGVKLLSPTKETHQQLSEAKRGDRRRGERTRKRNMAKPPPSQLWDETKHPRGVAGRFANGPEHQAERKRLRAQVASAVGGTAAAKKRRLAMMSPQHVVRVSGQLPPLDPSATRRMPDLESKLPLPFEVWATTNTNQSFVEIPAPRIYLSAPVVAALEGGPKGQPVQGVGFAQAIYTLYHEFWHLAFSEHNEQQTDLGSVSIMRDMLRRYWGLSDTEAQQMYEMVAGTPGKPGQVRSSYHPDYTPDARDPLLGDAQSPPEKPGKGGGGWTRR